MSSIFKYTILIIFIVGIVVLLFPSVLGRYQAPIYQYGRYHKLHFMGTTHCREYMTDSIFIGDTASKAGLLSIEEGEIQDLGLSQRDYLMCLYQYDEGSIDGESVNINSQIVNNAQPLVDSKYSSQTPDDNLLFSVEMPWPDSPVQSN